VGSLSEYAEVLGPATRAAWPTVAEIVPAGTVLMGGTALAMQLRHRRSEDLDLFTPHVSAPRPLHAAPAAQSDIHLARKSQGHLHGTFNDVKIDILWGADAATLRPPTPIAGLPVGSLQDIMATKFRAISSRHLLRDYFDVMSLEQLAGISVEEGFTLYLQKYGLSVNHGSVHALVAGFGYFDDVLDDPILQGVVGEDVRDRVVGFFTERHPAIVRSVVQGPELPDLL